MANLFEDRKRPPAARVARKRNGGCARSKRNRNQVSVSLRVELGSQIPIGNILWVSSLKADSSYRSGTFMLNCRRVCHNVPER